MRHSKRCDTLVKCFRKLGYTEFFQRRRQSTQPDHCDSFYFFYPDPDLRSPNYQMYRGYVHDTQNIVYLRINIPGVKYGLGMEPFQLDPSHPQFTEQVSEFCQTDTLSKMAVLQLLEEFRVRQGSTKTREKVICDSCQGTKIDLHRRRVYPEHPSLACRSCKGKPDKYLVTETYYVYR